MFGKDKKEDVGKPLCYFAKYVGGHIRFPSDENCMVWIYPDKLIIDLLKSKHQFNISYSSMVDMKNADGGNKIDLGRVVLTGVLVGLLWKKQHVLTVIEYKDDKNESRTLVLDFESNARHVQPIIYDRMVSAKTMPTPIPTLTQEPTAIQEHLGGPFN
jgi:hypothetical protein